MKSSSSLKKIMWGIALSDAHIQPNGRLDMDSKHKDYVDYLYNVFQDLTHTVFTTSVKKDKRGYTGYRLTSRTSKYLLKLRQHLYPNGRKEVTKYVVDRLGPESWAHIWMCDGYLEHSKNRKTGKCQNIGWFCLEAFTKGQLKLLQDNLSKLGIESSLVAKPWGHGYRIRIGGENLQRFISFIYPHVLPCFRYKTELFYKQKSTALDLPSAEQYIKTYRCIEDIVRHSQKWEKT